MGVVKLQVRIAMQAMRLLGIGMLVVVSSPFVASATTPLRNTVIGNGWPFAERFEPRDGLETARSSRHRAEDVLAGLELGGSIVNEADGGRRPKTIRGNPG